MTSQKPKPGFIGNNLWDACRRSLLLHILAQRDNHGAAYIYGSPKALERLAAALLDAAGRQQGEVVSVPMMPADGDHYSVKISPMSDRQMDKIQMPYSQPGKPE